ncbi:ligand-dependent nuclear receptor-interacting factor 1 [Oryzias melastigma]|uniref:ligand-dependent nuclear receptor-interacting factor 1 n=1 Tax=Oryzias melastigma TaxID=30732 RepID=UPI000CF8180E|nr:ligand-dependent nuclear receptor-interacting factor 1 [Oryzias melastigma]
MDARHRAGVFYRAMPAVGADGKNIMKLIPVPMARRRFDQTLPGRPPSHLQKPPSRAAPLLQNRRDLQLPVTVKSPALPQGQCLQIPPHAQVQRVPASHLPPGVKERIFASSPSSGLASVVYVSPVTAVDQAPPGPPRPLCTGLKPHLKLIPKVSQRPSSPTRWVIEEAEDPKPPPASGVHEDALVVCNGKVFFVGLKSSSALKTAPETRPPNCRPPPESGEVIDLCEEEEPDAAGPRPDEDNVIFVSYTHPRSEPGSTHDPTAKGPSLLTSSGGGRSFSLGDVDVVCSSEATREEQRAMDPPLMDPPLRAGLPAEKVQPCEDPASSRTGVLGFREGDRRLMRMFGIHAELRVTLPKIHAAAAHLQGEEPTGRRIEVEPLRLNSPGEADGGAPPGESWSPGEESRCCPQSQSMVGYVEPIDEDLPEVPPPPQTCAAVSRRRVGRTRKRTTCPCCIPAALFPAWKSGPEEAGGGTDSTSEGPKKRRKNLLEDQLCDGQLSSRGGPFL